MTENFGFGKGYWDGWGQGLVTLPQLAKHQDCAIPAARTVLLVLSDAEICCF